MKEGGVKEEAPGVGAEVKKSEEGGVKEEAPGVRAEVKKVASKTC